MLFFHRPHSLIKLSIAGATILLCIVFVLYYHPTGIIGLKNIPTAIGTTPLETKPKIISKIPEKLWYKIGPKGLSDESRTWMDDCLQKNPSYRSEIMTDLSGDLYVKENFAFRPDIVETYLALPIPILKADLLRYMLLYTEGGIWHDLDVSCEDIPMHDWVPVEFKDKANLVLGWEFDVGWGETIMRQFVSWTVMSAPKSPHMWMVIEDIINAVHKKTEEHHIPISLLTKDMLGDVVDFTGPRRLTISVLKSLELTLNETIDQKSIHNLLDPKLVGDVLILPGYSFAASSNRYGTNQNLTGPPLVTHHYAGSWKNQNGGEMRRSTFRFR
ncbi:hypothetical protein SI65_01249 [Aspergillus cristatus]|uniref:Initiation-specific alpha-1,6-mannosyltransferase n=1 Tax=Aspergillus cristatus TaxID=573508 RepID=A0A1E3BRS2_ASPCR|nr:hypothetical protein SI65_01249 [Aspergillus cristatus]